MNTLNLAISVCSSSAQKGINVWYTKYVVEQEVSVGTSVVMDEGSFFQETTYYRGYVSSGLVERKFKTTIFTFKDLLDLFFTTQEVYLPDGECISFKDLGVCELHDWDFHYEEVIEKYGEDNIHLILDEIRANRAEEKSTFMSKVKMLSANGRDDSEIRGVKTQNHDMVLQYHGLAAYSGDKDFALKLQNCLEQDYVICGSDKAIGPVGILFEGPVYKMYCRDIWSDAEERQAVDRSISVSEEEFIRVSQKLTGHRQYIETFTQPEWVYAIWCHPDVPDHIKEEVEEMAKDENLKVIYCYPNRLGKNMTKEEFDMSW